MATQSRALLKTWFETGDTPTEAQFADLMDSMSNIADDFGVSGKFYFLPVTIQVADLKTLNSAPSDIIPTGGANTIIAPSRIYARMVFAAVAYANNLTPHIRIAGAADSLFVFPGNWLGNVATSFIELTRIGGAPSQSQYIENAALQIINPVGDSINGDSLLELFLLYQIPSV